MTDYFVSDTDLTSVANAIRTKGGTSAPLSFPDGFNTAIANIPTGGGGGLSGDYNTLDISFTNPSGISEFGGIEIQMLLSDAHESTAWYDAYTDRMLLASLNNPNETITIYLPVEAYGIVIEPWSRSPDGTEYGDSDLTITGSLTYLGGYNGYQIRVQGPGTITIDGVEYDP